MEALRGQRHKPRSSSAEPFQADNESAAQATMEPSTVCPPQPEAGYGPYALITETGATWDEGSMCGQGEDGEEGEEDGSDCGEEEDDDAPSRPQAESGPSSGTATPMSGEASSSASVEVLLVPSLFPHRPATIFFPYPPELNIRREGPSVSERLLSRKLLFRSFWERNSVKDAFLHAGFRRAKGNVWNACWIKHPTPEGFRAMNRFQKVNHFPGSWCIGRKDRLLRTLSKARRLSALHTRALDFFPEGYVLPQDHDSFQWQAKTNEKAIWILKPPASSCGKGIKVLDRSGALNVHKDKKCVIQRYVADPFLIDGRKFDLRLYVLVTSVDPLRVYLFQEGLVRFSTYAYNLKHLSSRYSHLTNFSVNRKSKHFQANQDASVEDEGNKWTLSALWRWLTTHMGEEASKQTQQRIKDVIVKTLVAAEGELVSQEHRHLRYRNCCYELFGFDVLLDAKLQPWLLEVNVSPSLVGSSPLDRRIKGLLMADVFHCVGFVPYDGRQVRNDRKSDAERRLYPATSSLNPNNRKPDPANPAGAAPEKKVKQGCGRKLSVGNRKQDAFRKDPRPESIEMGELTPEDWDIIYETEDEFQRRGHFERLFPCAERSESILPLFASRRFADALLARYLAQGGLSSLPRRVRVSSSLSKTNALTRESSLPPRLRESKTTPTGDPAPPRRPPPPTHPTHRRRRSDESLASTLTSHPNTTQEEEQGGGRFLADLLSKVAARVAADLDDPLLDPTPTPPTDHATRPQRDLQGLLSARDLSRRAAAVPRRARDVVVQLRLMKPLDNHNNNNPKPPENNNDSSNNHNSNDSQAKRQAGFLQAEEEGEVEERGERQEGRLFGEAPGDDALIPRMHRSTVPDDTLMPPGKGTERRFIERLEGIY